MGIITRDLRFNSTVKQEELVKVISDLNADNDVHGVLVQLPLPAQIDQNDMISKLDPLKDVDGLTPFNAGMLLKGNPQIMPCTSCRYFGIVRFLSHRRDGDGRANH